MVNDGGTESEPAMVDITIAPVNDRPAANAQSVTTTQDTPVAIPLTGTDIDDNSLKFTIVPQPMQGTLSGTPPDLVYTPDPGFTGSDVLQLLK